MSGAPIGTMDDKSVRASSEALLRDLYILAGKEPPLYYDQLNDLANDLKTSFPKLTFEEVKLAGKAGIAGELGDVRTPSYASIMRWTEAYTRSPQLADTRKIIANRPVVAPRLSDEQGLLSGGITEERAEAFANWAAEHTPTGSNLRGSAAYRTHLVQVLCRRALMELGGKN